MKNKGFTLIEMMVAIGLFTIVVVIGIQSIISVYRVHNKNEDQRVLADNLTFAMEDMVRNLSSGSQINCNLSTVPTGDQNGYSASLDTTSSPCSNVPAVSFVPFDDPINRTAYALIGGNTFCDAKNNKRLYKSINNGDLFVPITPIEICLSSSQSGFLITGANTTDNTQPRTTIRLSGYIKMNNLKSNFRLQTSVSQRLIDLPQ